MWPRSLVRASIDHLRLMVVRVGWEHVVPGTALVGVAVSWRRSARHDKRDPLAMFITPPLLPVSLTVPTIEVWGEVGARCASEKRTLRPTTGAAQDRPPYGTIGTPAAFMVGEIFLWFVCDRFGSLVAGNGNAMRRTMYDIYRIDHRRTYSYHRYDTTYHDCRRPPPPPTAHRTRSEKY